jgi:hypothetical protein
MPSSNMGRWTWAILIGWLVVIGPGSIEGSAFPVLKDVTLKAQAVAGTEDLVSISGSAVKLRRCSPRALDWFQGKRGDLDAPASYTWGRVELRPVGPFEFEDWTVNVFPPDVLITQTHADALHQCYAWIPLGLLTGNIKDDIPLPLPWWTRTKFWN